LALLNLQTPCNKHTRNTRYRKQHATKTYHNVGTIRWWHQSPDWLHPPHVISTGIMLLSTIYNWCMTHAAILSEKHFFLANQRSTVMGGALIGK
jgi:hypothetical protein